MYQPGREPGSPLVTAGRDPAIIIFVLVPATSG
jgi:hypothetical protein